VFYLPAKILGPHNFAGSNAAIMNFQKYPVVAIHEQNMYNFDSEGSRGRIRKVILYQMIGDDLFNLSFGDWNEDLQKVDDSSRSNNGDRDKVLATVAYTALDFTDRFPSARIYIEGSTSARTRLYQLSIGSNILRIKEDFVVSGLMDGHWEDFRRATNYEAFLIGRK
jgi:hypothetical protein